jgi:hypothetical protein
MVGGLNRLLPKEINANRFFGDSHWLKIWSNHFCPSMGPNGGSVAMDSGMCCVRGICGQGENHPGSGWDKGIAANELDMVGSQVRNLG